MHDFIRELGPLRADFRYEAHVLFDFTDGIQSVESLSETELWRLRRAFWRYELLENLYGAVRATSRTLTGTLPEDIAHICCHYFHAWEIEEIACVKYYLKELVERTWREVEDQLTEDIVREATHLAESFKASGPRNGSLSRDLRYFMRRFASQDRPFSFRSDRQRWIWRNSQLSLS